MSFMRGKFTFLYTANTPKTDYNGSMYKKSRWTHVVYGQWSNKLFTVGLKYEHSRINTRTGAEIPGFSYEDAFTWSNLRNLLQLTLAYSFNKGSSRQQPGKRLYHSDNDNGLIESNTTR